MSMDTLSLAPVFGRAALLVTVAIQCMLSHSTSKTSSTSFPPKQIERMLKLFIRIKLVGSQLEFRELRRFLIKESGGS
ncbi:hypothetical protein IMY05_001G0028400 [Salix suchowensis]|nr:hypothetical protein IMY05_001G0028400 [Salix suchowensis]